MVKRRRRRERRRRERERKTRERKRRRRERKRRMLDSFCFVRKGKGERRYINIV